MDYRSLPRISNSDLSELLADVKGEVQKKPVKAFAFGTITHGLIIEPKVQQVIPDCVDIDLARKLASVARANPFLSWAIKFCKKETVQLWEDTATGLQLKARLDLVFRGSIVIDIKTTSCKSLADFLHTCEVYEYDRQAAFYLDSIGAKKFVFVAIQKVKPYNVWIVEHHTSGSFVMGGRKKYSLLLREWQRRETIGQPFVPSTWRTVDTSELAETWQNS